MAAYNRIIMVGNLTRDPDLKQLQSGQAVCRLNIASNRQSKNRQSGALMQEVCYIDVDVWGAQAESCRQYLQKGRSILVEGRLKLDSWKDADGQARSKHSIVADRVVFLGAGQGAEASSAEQTIGDDAVMAAAPATSLKKGRARQSSVEDELGTTGGMVFKDEAPFEDDLPF